MKTMKESEVQLYQWTVEPNQMKNTLLVGLLVGLLTLTTGCSHRMRSRLGPYCHCN